MDYFTEEEIQQIQNEVSGGAIGDFKAVVDEETATFNANAENTLTGYNANAQEKFETYNANANSKFSDYNTNAEEKFSKYTSNAEAKLSEYNQNYTEKLAEYNQNAETKTAEFDSNATEKLKAYNDNHTEKMTAYDTNAEQHTTEYNDNHNLKLAKYNANASEKLTTYDANAEQHTTDYNRNAAEKLEAYNQNHAAKVAEYNANAEAKTAEFDSNAAALQTEVDRLRGECDTLAAENRKQENRIDALIKLNKGQTYDILPEEGETASRTAQSGAKYVSVDKVGGKSIVWNQLFNVHKTQTSYGMQIVSDGQTITMSGNSGNHAWMSFTPGIREFTALNARNHLYLYSIFVVENSSTEEIDFGLLNRNNSAAIIPANYTGKVNFVCTVTNPDAGSSIGFSRLQPNTDYNVRIVVSAYDLTLMFGAGNEPTAEQFERMFPADSYQYNPGEIISGTTSSVELTPGNVFPGTVPVKYFPCKIKKGETFTASAKCKINEVKCRYASEDKSQKDYYTLSDLVGTYAEGNTRYKRKIKAYFDIAFVMFDVSEGKTASDFVVEIGDGDGTYKRYFEPVKFSTGFSELRSALAAHDYIDMDGEKVHRKIKTVRIDGNTQIYGVSVDADANCCRIVFENALTPGIIGSKNERVKSNIISDRLTTISHADYLDNSLRASGINVYESLQAVCFRLHDRTDIDTKEKAKAWLAENPTTVFYEIESEEVTDVTIQEPLQEWLPVEAGGTVTFRNADESKQLAVPNAVSWVRKLNEVE